MLKTAVILSVFTALFVFSASTRAQNEIPAFDFLRVEPSARGSALGGAFDAYTNDPNALFYNPASVSTTDSRQVSAGFGKYLLDINFGTLAYVQKFKDKGWIGVGVKYFNYGKFDYSDENGNLTGGTFGASDLMFSAVYSNLIYDKVNYGITVKYIYSSIATYKSSALGFDMGLMYLMPENGVTLSLTLNNLGTQLSSYISTKEKLPLDLRVGFSKKLEHTPLNVSVTFSKLNQSTDKIIQHLRAFAIGGEFMFGENVVARIGYNNEHRQDMKLGTTLGLAGFSAGLGLKFAGKYMIDYGFNSDGKIGSMHRFNVGYAFNK